MTASAKSLPNLCWGIRGTSIVGISGKRYYNDVHYLCGEVVGGRIHVTIKHRD